MRKTEVEREMGELAYKEKKTINQLANGQCFLFLEKYCSKMLLWLMSR
jgi:hypothetical protein